MSRDLDPEHLDTEHLARQTDGDVALERELLVLFDRQCVRLLPLIVGAGDHRARAEAAHTLTGSARAVGAARVARDACALERELGPGEGRETNRLAGLLAEAVAVVRALISGRLAAREDAGFQRPG